MKVAIFTLGCKVNQYESEVLGSAFLDAGYELSDFEDFCDVYVINTCTVTNTSDQKSRQMIHKARKKNPGAIVAVTGCYPQANEEKARALSDVDLIMGTTNRLSLVDRVTALLKDRRKDVAVEIGDVFAETVFEPLSLKKSAGRTRATVKIEDGCENFCSYCIIPFARGKVRSKPPEAILSEVESLARAGYLEIVLTGIHLASYGRDLPDASLFSILKRIDALQGNFRVRLGSLEPTLFTKDSVAALSSLRRLCPHFHLSLQSGCDATLERMNRKYKSEEFFRSAEALREAFPGAALTTDVIVGFPGETQEDFLSSLAFVEKVGFSKVHVFPYSKRAGTKAASLPGQIEKSEKSRRCREMIASCEKSERVFLESKVGKTLDVVFESGDGTLCEGTSAEYLTVSVRSEKDLKNTRQNVLITDISGPALLGRL